MRTPREEDGSAIGGGVLKEAFKRQIN